MKKILSILAGILAVVSCDFPGVNVYSVTNVGDYLNCSGGKLTSDYGREFTVVEDQTDKNWLGEGNRMHAVFDILNADFDITLKSYMLANVKPVAGKQETELLESSDPVDIQDCCISGRCLNLILSYYVKKDSDYNHGLDLDYNDKNGYLTLFLIHDGNGESPVNHAEEDLEKVTSVFCFPITPLVPEGEYRYILFEYDYLTKSGEGKYSVAHASNALYNQQLQF